MNRTLKGLNYYMYHINPLRPPLSLCFDYMYHINPLHPPLSLCAETTCITLTHYILSLSLCAETTCITLTHYILLCPSLGAEPLHVSAADLNAAAGAHFASYGHAPLPGHGQHAGLRAPARPALHGRHRGHPGVHGGAHGGHQAARSPHGPQPAGQPLTPPSPPPSLPRWAGTEDMMVV